jgi:hypothetical protein
MCQEKNGKKMALIFWEKSKKSGGAFRRIRKAPPDFLLFYVLQ